MHFVKNGIRSGLLAPGQRLREREILEQCSVSRSAIREALRTLAADGTLLLEPRRSAIVPQFTREEVWSHLQIREVLEGLAASLAASRIAVSGQQRDLLEVEKRMSHALSKNDNEAYLQLNYELHKLIVQISGNVSIQQHLDRAMTTQIRMQAARFMDGEDMMRSHTEHKAVIHAILIGDPAEAEAAMRRHIRGTGRTFHEMPETIFGSGFRSTAAT